MASMLEAWRDFEENLITHFATNVFHQGQVKWEKPKASFSSCDQSTA